MKFQIYKNGQIVDKFRLCGTYLFGTDGITIRRAKISFRNGSVLCNKPNLGTAGLALLWPIEGFGNVLLPTTCLPEREEPYILNVEIARARLMQIINKREEWSFFEPIEGLQDISEQARDLLIQAVQNISDPTLASKLADESLEKAILFSEKLAIEQAKVNFDAREKNHGFGRGCLGCRIDPGQIKNPAYLEKMLTQFNRVMVPVNWAQIEAEQGNYDFSSLDACIEILSKKKLVISAGPLLCFSKEFLPEWLIKNGESFEKIREWAYQFICQTVSRYQGSVRAWRVISGINAFNCFEFTFEQVLEMTRAANMAVKASCDRSLKIIEISNPWGEYYATTSATIPPLVYMDMVVQSGINFDAFGLQMHFGKNQAGMHVRDMMQISGMLDYFGHIAKPLHITELEVPSKAGTDSQTGNVAGVWHKQWDQDSQEQWIEQFYKIALSKPFVDSVTYSNLADTKDSTIANSGLLTEQLEPKKSFNTLKQLRELIFNR